MKKTNRSKWHFALGDKALQRFQHGSFLVLPFFHDRTLHLARNQAQRSGPASEIVCPFAPSQLLLPDPKQQLEALFSTRWNQGKTEVDHFWTKEAIPLRLIKRFGTVVHRLYSLKIHYICKRKCRVCNIRKEVGFYAKHVRWKRDHSNYTDLRETEYVGSQWGPAHKCAWISKERGSSIQ